MDVYRPSRSLTNLIGRLARPVQPCLLTTVESALAQRAVLLETLGDNRARGKKSECELGHVWTTAHDMSLIVYGVGPTLNSGEGGRHLDAAVM